jgi:hypothetical protein
VPAAHRKYYDSMDFVETTTDDDLCSTNFNVDLLFPLLVASFVQLQRCLASIIGVLSFSGQVWSTMTHGKPSASLVATIFGSMLCHQPYLPAPYQVLLSFESSLLQSSVFLSSLFRSESSLCSTRRSVGRC